MRPRSSPRVFSAFSGALGMSLPASRAVLSSANRQAIWT
jgi:hypothetical protein